MNWRVLLVLDMNGVLFHRLTKKEESDNAKTHPRARTHDHTVNGNKIHIRPHTAEFLRFAFKNFDVAFWSSMQEENTFLILDRILSVFPKHISPVFVYTRSMCTLVPKYKQKPLAKKDLRRIWALHRKYTPQNTLIVDDSLEKTEMFPHNRIVPTEYTVADHGTDFTEDSELQNIRRYLQSLLEEQPGDVRKYTSKTPFKTRETFTRGGPAQSSSCCSRP
ncbi:MAG: NLI interacting factor family phosphatase [Amphiamblys sp. WSBS2006]|nr:MAG: NLI interacting factor family phosphatase [Amphiamblys sp. WSBS2006]